MKSKTIYHIVTLEELKKQTTEKHYKPVNFDIDGFIHCTAGKETSLLVLADYFAEASKKKVILILEIDEKKLKPEVRYEPPAPVPGGGTSHLKEQLLFPHIYGSVNTDAIIGVGRVERIDNTFHWPLRFDALSNYLEK